jgi:hypothetical protein
MYCHNNQNKLNVTFIGDGGGWQSPKNSSTTTEMIKSPIQFTIGDGGSITPQAGTTDFTSSVFYIYPKPTVHLNGPGYLTNGTDFEYINSGGLVMGIRLIGGRVFYPEEFYTIELFNQ